MAKRKKSKTSLLARGSKLWSGWRDPKMTGEQAFDIVINIKKILDAGDPERMFLGIFNRWPIIKARLFGVLDLSVGEAAAELRDIADAMEYVSDPKSWKHKLDAGGKRRMPLSEFYQILHLTQTDDNAHEMLVEMIQEAVQAKANESKGGDEGIFAGFHDERDAIIKLALQGERPWIERQYEMMKIIRKMIPQQRAKLQTLQSELVVEEHMLWKKKNITRLLEAMVVKEREGWVLQGNDCSRLHKVHEALKAGLFAGMQPKGVGDVVNQQVVIPSNSVPFIVKHNWAAVMAASEGDRDGEVSLPAPRCAFEFRISGFNVVWLVSDPKDPEYKPFMDDKSELCLIEGFEGFWFIMGADQAFYSFVRAQFHAACVVIEAQAAKYTLVQAPAALNKKRLSQGKLPLYDFHVIDLNRENKRYVGDRVKSDEPHSRHRLHFVRAHDRHYKDKGIVVRIPWHLRGDPELGFVDKLYTL